MASPRLLVLALLVFTIAADPPPAAACSVGGNGMLQLDPQQAADRTPPSIPTINAAATDFSEGTRCTSCGDYASIKIEVTATDDATPPQSIGYQVTHVGGSLPPGLELERSYRPGPVTPAYSDTLVYYYDPDVEDVNVDLEVRAVDLNGNLGPPIVVEIRDHGGGGCSARRGRTRGWDALALVMLALVITTRRRRRC